MSDAGHDRGGGPDLVGSTKDSWEEDTPHKACDIG